MTAVKSPHVDAPAGRRNERLVLDRVMVHEREGVTHPDADLGGRVGSATDFDADRKINYSRCF
jgi:hypothetical protein